MPKRPSLRIPEYELDDLFAAFEVFAGVAEGRFSETLEPGAAGPAYRCSWGGVSYYTRVWDAEGQPLARVHYAECGFGHTIGVWPEALFFPALTLFRLEHQRRLGGSG